MEIKNIGYNIGEVTIDVAMTSGTPVELGTLEEFQKVYNIAKNSCIARLNANIGGTDMSGCCFLNPFGPAEARGVDIAGVSNFSDAGTLIHGTLYTEGGKMYGVVTVTPLTATRGAKTSTKTTAKS